MKKINKHIYQELFIDQKVKCNQGLYCKLYSKIWPCENLFKEFLLSIDTSVQLEKAKKIFYYFNSLNDFLIPDFVVEELISIQQYRLQRTEGYIPQDHLLHSINLYILGIYIFFNMEVFQRKILNEYIEQDRESNMELFIKEWKLFALYHDIGYVLEGYVDKEGFIYNAKCIEKYEKLHQCLIYKHAVHSVANVILNTYILNQSDRKPKFHLDFIKKSQWMYEGTNISGTDLYNILKRYKEWSKLELVASERERKYVEWVMQDTEYLVEYEDEDGHSVAFAFINGDGHAKYAYSSNFKSYGEFYSTIKK